MEIKRVRYSVEWSGKTIWDDYFSDGKSFDDEAKAIAFIKDVLAKDERIDRAYYTTTKTIYFDHEN